MTEKRLLILGGSMISKEIVKTAKDMGAYVVVTDWYSIESSPAKQIADKSFDVSTKDIEGLLKIIEDENINGILTGFTDSSLVDYYNICSASGLPCYGEKEHFELFTDKKSYKELFQKYDIPVIEEVTYKNIENISERDFPLLVKPVDGSGSKGISISNSIEELRNDYNEALQVSQKKQVLVEKYIQGKELTVFLLFDNGKVKVTGIGDRIMRQTQGEGILPLPVGYLFPSIQTENFYSNNLKKFEKLFKDINIKHGMMFMQCIVDENEIIKVYDVGYRLTGSLEYHIQEEILGYNPLKMLINYAFKNDYGINKEFDTLETTWHSIGWNYSRLINSGVTLKEYKGADKACEFKGIIASIPTKLEKKLIPSSIKGTLAQIGLRVLGTAKDTIELLDQLSYLNANVDFIGNEDKSIALPGLEKKIILEELNYLKEKYDK